MVKDKFGGRASHPHKGTLRVRKPLLDERKGKDGPWTDQSVAGRGNGWEPDPLAQNKQFVFFETLPSNFRLTEFYIDDLLTCRRRRGKSNQIGVGLPRP